MAELSKDGLLALAQHLVYEHLRLVNDDCELTGFGGEGRCIEDAVAARFEDGFLDLVCVEHAARARARGAVVVDAKKADGALPTGPSTLLRGYELQFRTDPDSRWTSVFGTVAGSPTVFDESFIRARYICDAAEDASERPADAGFLEWRIVRVIEEVVEPPRTSQQVVDWFVAP